MTEIEKIRKSKASKWSSFWIVCTVLWFCYLLFHVWAGKLGLAVITSCAFTTFLLVSYAVSQKKLYKELIEELDLLKQELNSKQSK